ncbi:Synaptotagmin, SMP domain [Dillenia turbinata]|uniref:Synaptotagmin, SMP domain n=1 Tax=Dillenia turbinata TaxID=194707 RepID=A0AAN8ZC88_9MAGN
MSKTKPTLKFWRGLRLTRNVEWLNKFIANMWPYLDKAICGVIRSISKPTFEKYIGKFQIRSSDFETLSLGTLPPTLQGIKIYETNENELVIEPAVRWAGNPNITLAMKLLFLSITVQVEEIADHGFSNLSGAADCFEAACARFPLFC